LIAALLVLVATAAPPPAGGCAVVEISAEGRGAHGATLVPHSAAHRLIRALDRLPAWARTSEPPRRQRIVALTAAGAVNVIAPRATALVEVSLDGDGSDAEAVLRELRAALGPDVEATLAARPCGAAGNAADGAGADPR